MTETCNYLDRRKNRLARTKLKQHIVFGLIVSFFILAVSGLKYYLEIGGWDSLWRVTMWIGLMLFALTILLPSIWEYPELALRKLASMFGSLIFSIMLSLLYFIFFWPMGIIVRKIYGMHPIYCWQQNPPEQTSYWQDKSAEVITEDSKFPFILQPLSIILWFMKKENCLFLPVIIILIILGLLLFFVQTSSLAPFIYTIF